MRGTRRRLGDLHRAPHDQAPVHDMAAYLIRRLWQMVPTLVGVVLLVFLLFKCFGGDPAEILGGLNATPSPDRRDPPAARARRAVWAQLGIFLKQIVTFDWGKSWATNEAVEQPVRDAPAGDADGDAADPDPRHAAGAADRDVGGLRARLADRPRIMVITTVALSISFLVYIIVGQYLFGFQLGWFPVQGWSDSVWTNLRLRAAAGAARGVVGARAADAPVPQLLPRRARPRLRAHRARQGPDRNAVLFKHVLRNAMIPILTNVRPALPGIFVGSFLIEVFFSIPGLGREVLLAVNRSDYPVIQAVTMYLAVITMVDQPVTDLLYKLVDPRVVLK